MKKLFIILMVLALVFTVPVYAEEITVEKAVADAVFIVGCGTSNTNRKNAMVVKRDGTIEYGK